MLVATAGHVDHGKTALIRRLTDVDTDRLPEEKRRGLSIDLGFAYRAMADDRVVGFVDVPGHERFVRNMLAGVPGVDLALLVVAADDGPMPQTREHLAILGLLGVPELLVAITKIDRVTPARVQKVEALTREILTESDLPTAAFYPLSNVTGEGVAELERQLFTWVARSPSPPVSGAFRLAIDRHFNLPGTGLVMTGAVFAGTVSRGDRLRLLPGGQAMRVRGIHAQGKAAERGLRGERLALNLAGPVELQDLRRGQWLVAAEPGRLSDRFDAEVRVLADEPRALAHWTPVHVHHGASDLNGRVATLGGRAIPPGVQGLVQIVVSEATHLVHGDRFVLRDQSALRTVAGGRVIDPFAPREGRHRDSRLQHLTRLKDLGVADAFEELMERAPDGVETNTLAATYNLTRGETDTLLSRTATHALTLHGRTVVVSADRYGRVRRQLVQELADWHRHHPDRLGLEMGALQGEFGRSESRQLQATVVEDLIRDGEVRRRGRLLGLSGHQPTLPEADAALWERVSALLAPAQLQPPVVSDLARELGVQPRELKAFLDRAAIRGQLVRVSANRYLHPTAVARLGSIAESLAAQSPDGQFDAKTYKSAAGIGRNFCIQLLEHFDVLKLTRRIGHNRTVIGVAARIYGDV